MFSPCVKAPKRYGNSIFSTCIWPGQLLAGPTTWKLHYRRDNTVRLTPNLKECNQKIILRIFVLAAKNGKTNNQN